jgi:hypothetical protein
MKNLPDLYFFLESYQKPTQAGTYSESQMNYFENILNKNLIKNKYVLSILATVRKNGGRYTHAQNAEIRKALRGG